MDSCPGDQSGSAVHPTARGIAGSFPSRARGRGAAPGDGGCSAALRPCSRPLLRATLVRLADTDHRLFVTLHHITLMASPSTQVFLPELRTLLRTPFRPDSPYHLPTCRFSMPILPSGSASGCKGTCCRPAGLLEAAARGSSCDPGNLPTISASIAPNLSRLDPTFGLSKPLSDALARPEQSGGSTLYMTLTAPSTRYSIATQDRKIFSSARRRGRKHPEVQKLMGVFINSPRRPRLGHAAPTCPAIQSFSELLGRCERGDR